MTRRPRRLSLDSALSRRPANAPRDVLPDDILRIIALEAQLRQSRQESHRRALAQWRHQARPSVIGFNLLTPPPPKPPVDFGRPKKYRAFT
mmetsp:Transcript_19584/g.65796  ORF Transcript_19584/g.65796 Transcript_19584/m.65796 type:complete len:91 (-) Transcript_19584:655-927(-)